MSTTERSYSLRQRMLIRSGLLLLAVLLLLSLGVWHYARQAADYSYDRLLNSASLSILEGLSVREDQIDLDLPYAALEMMQLAPDDKVFYRVSAPSGGLLTGYEDLPPPRTSRPVSETPIFYSADYRGERLRLVLQNKRVTEPSVSGWVQVVLGHTLSARKELMFDLVYKALLTLLGVILLALAVLWLGINRALQPLNMISSLLRRDTSPDAPPLPATPIHEIAPLIDAINGSRQQLLNNLDGMKTFIADASHQIRTAQSATQAQLDIAAQCRDSRELPARLSRIRQEHLRLTRLTNQLLAHAMVVHRGDTQPHALIDLDALLKQVLTECVRDHAHRAVEFAYHGETCNTAIKADGVSLREAIRNLLDNAVRYGPEDNHVELTLMFSATTGVDILVDDRGPGIPPHLRRQALQRFGRLATDAEGSGLGLSIVQSVAEAHGGKLSLEDSPLGGLRIRLHLPEHHE